MRFILFAVCVIFISVVQGQQYGRTRTRPNRPPVRPRPPIEPPILPGPADPCQFGNSGPCTGHGLCPAGSTCRRNDWNGRRVCCNNQPATCPIGSNFCGGIGGIQCPFGQTCVLQGNFPDAGGCCRQNAGTCPAGSFCGGIAGIQCPAGLTCVLDGNFPDAGGCCRANIGNCLGQCGGRWPNVQPCRPGYMCQNGQCCISSQNNRCPPPPRDMAGPCVIDPAVNCLQDSECETGAICCPHLCGKVCRLPQPW